MDMNKLKLLNLLEIRVDPTYRRMEMTNNEYLTLVNEMKDEGFIYFDVIKGHPIFDGEPKKIYRLEAGKEYYEKYKEYLHK